MPYTAKDYSPLVGLKGFSETLLKNHFTLYQGYVTNTNKVADTLAQMLKEGKTGTPEFAELKRRFGWEFNGMRLHELYFENMKGAGGIDKSGKLAKRMKRSLAVSMRGKRTSRLAARCGESDGWSFTMTRPVTGCSIPGSMSMMWPILPDVPQS